VDLVTVASAIHWFDLDAFYAEVRRVIRPGGLLAAWTYHIGYVEPPFDQIFRRFYFEVLYPYFAPGARLVDERYQTITLPGEALPAGEWSTSASWNLDQMLAFIASWSGTKQYIKERGEDPVALIAEDLEHVWGGRDRIHVVRWPLYTRISRL
jgi:SAM-dependent methyltransferase